MALPTTPHPRILQAITADRWAIQEDALARIVLIAQGLNDSPESVSAQLGRPLDNTHGVIRRGSTAIVPVTGPIFRYANLFTEISGATSIQTLATDFRAAVDDPAIEAIILEIDSPGGQVAGVSEFAAQVREATAIKPVIAYVSDLGASAAYWIASAADRVIARDTARLGSIGVVLRTTAGADPKELKFISSQSPRKHAPPDSATGQELLQAEVDSLAQVFIDAVAGYRGVTPETVLSDFGKGGVLVGIDAVTAGLADDLGSLESLIAKFNGPHPSTPWSQLMTAKTPQPNALTRETLAAEAPDVLQALLDEGHQAGYAAGLAAGATAERQRIQDVQAQALPGHEALIAALAYDGKTTGAEAAIQVITAERAAATARLNALRADTPQPLPFAGSDAAKPPPDANAEVHRQVAADGDFLIKQVSGAR